MSANAPRMSWEQDIVRQAQETLARLRIHQPVATAVQLTARQLAAMIDHTLLKAEATPAMVDKLCAEARAYRFASVCVNPYNVAQCARALQGSGVLVGSVAGFPLGAALAEVKAYEAERAIADGANEIDMVLNIGALKAGLYAVVRDDMAAVAHACHSHGAHSKVILETCLLSDEEKVAACLLAVQAGVDYVKTSTGLSSGGATAQDVALMRAVVGPGLGVKAAGGIRTCETALAMVAAGATRLGASAGPQILQGLPA
jgi:deoxyribose-phosphate aldolase